MLGHKDHKVMLDPKELKEQSDHKDREVTKERQVLKVE
jgi:hypothetical protein